MTAIVKGQLPDVVYRLLSVKRSAPLLVRPEPGSHKGRPKTRAEWPGERPHGARWRRCAIRSAGWTKDIPLLRASPLPW